MSNFIFLFSEFFSLNLMSTVSILRRFVVLRTMASSSTSAAASTASGNMYHIVPSSKSFDATVSALQKAVTAHQFGVLHIHDLGSTLRSKGQDFKQECKVFEVCNPKQAARVLSADMRLNMALPCRISVYTEAAAAAEQAAPAVKIGMIKPAAMLAMLSPDPQLVAVANEVEETTVRIIQQAADPAAA